MIPECVVVDFETQGIDFEAPTRRAPEPVGMAVRAVDGGCKYYAFGHPADNGVYEKNSRGKTVRTGPCTWEMAKRAAAALWGGKRPLLFQNAKFDLDVAQQHFGLGLPAWERVHDPMYTLFLRDPHSPTGLKPAAERWLGMPPEERDAIRDWLIDHKVIPKDASEDMAASHIADAPGSVVAPYAIGDVVRAWRIFEKLQPWVIKNGMEPAYDVERELMPHLLENEYAGIRFDVDRAAKDLVVFRAAREKARQWLLKRLKIKDDGFNLDSDVQLADALDRAGVVTDWVWTKKSGQRSTAKKNMTIDKFHDRMVFQVLGYYNRLGTVMSLNLEPWLAMAQQHPDHRVYTTWNQVKQMRTPMDPSGARSGRLSCSRFQNVAKDFSDKGDGYEHPTVIRVPPLPLVRRYLLPDKGGVFCHRDYNQQEFRILAHFEDGDMLQAYLDDPRLDYHDLMRDRLHKSTGEEYSRRLVKMVNFAINYGTGVASLAGMAHVDLELAKALREAARRAAPGVEQLNRALKKLGQEGKAIRTWGGRLYYCEPPGWSERFGRYTTYEYKLMNYLIQGSAADAIKRAMVRLFRHPKFSSHARFLVAVHDEADVSAHTPADVKPAMRILREVMESLGSYHKGAPGVAFDVPMLTDGKTGPSWGELTKYEEA